MNTTATFPRATLPVAAPPAAEAAASDNAILAISARAAELRARGVDVISLAAGEPDTPTPSHITRAAADAALHGDHHYGPAAGNPALRAAVASTLPRQPMGYSAADVQIALGTKHALYLALAALTTGGEQVGGEVLLADPGWPGHTGAIIAADTVPVPVPVTGVTGFLATAEDFERVRTPRTRAVLLASPANPSGAVYEERQLVDIARWALENDVWIVSDDVYGKVVYKGTVPHVVDLVPEVRERCVIVGGVSKAYAMTGWRIGWLAGPSAVITESRRRVSRTITHVPHVTQAAALAALTGDQNPVREAVDRYRANRDLLVAALRTVPGVDCPSPDGGMFVFPDVTGLLARGPWQGTVELAEWLLERAGIAVVPGEAFHAPGHLRLCFATGPETVAAAAERLTEHLSHKAEPVVAR